MGLYGKKEELQIMIPDRKMVKVVGVLFFLQMATAILSYSVILDPILYSEDFPTSMATNSTAVVIAVILDLVCGLSVFAIAVLLYPILNKYNERIALWYTGLRLGELMGFVITGVLLLTLLSMGMESQSLDSSGADQMISWSTYLLSARVHTQNISLFLYCFGASMFYFLLLRTELVPRFISLWGLVGLTGILTEILLSMFGISTASFMHLIMLPMGLNELFLGFWLIVSGLKPSPDISPSHK